MQDRRLLQDDNRGLGQGVMDNRPTLSLFRLVVEEPQRVSHLNFQLTLLTLTNLWATTCGLQKCRSLLVIYLVQHLVGNVPDADLRTSPLVFCTQTSSDLNTPATIVALKVTQLSKINSSIFTRICFLYKCLLFRLKDRTHLTGWIFTCTEWKCIIAVQRTSKCMYRQKLLPVNVCPFLWIILAHFVLFICYKMLTISIVWGLFSEDLFL